MREGLVATSRYLLLVDREGRARGAYDGRSDPEMRLLGGDLAALDGHGTSTRATPAG